MPTPWSEVINKDEYKTLSFRDKSLAKQQYFDSVVKPKLHPDDYEPARKQFIAESIRLESPISKKESLYQGFVKPTVIGAGNVAGNVLSSMASFIPAGLSGIAEMSRKGTQQRSDLYKIPGFYENEKKYGTPAALKMAGVDSGKLLDERLAPAGKAIEKTLAFPQEALFPLKTKGEEVGMKAIGLPLELLHQGSGKIGDWSEQAALSAGLDKDTAANIGAIMATIPEGAAILLGPKIMKETKAALVGDPVKVKARILEIQKETQKAWTEQALKEPKRLETLVKAEKKINTKGKLEDLKAEPERLGKLVRAEKGLKADVLQEKLVKDMGQAKTGIRLAKIEEYKQRVAQAAKNIEESRGNIKESTEFNKKIEQIKEDREYIPDHLADAFEQIASEAKNSQTKTQTVDVNGVRKYNAASSPEWMTKLNETMKLDKKPLFGRKEIKTLINNAKSNKLTPKQMERFNHLKDVAKDIADSGDLGGGKDIKILEGAGYEIIGKEIPSADIQLGSRVVGKIKGVEGEFEHVGIDKAGNSLFKDKNGETYVVDPFDTIDAMGIKKPSKVPAEAPKAAEVKTSPETQPKAQPEVAQDKRIDIETRKRIDERLKNAKTVDEYNKIIEEETRPKVSERRAESRGPDRRIDQLTRREIEKELSDPNITKERAIEIAKETTSRAYTDALTRLENSRAYAEFIESEKGLPENQKSYQASVDLDNFSWWNDVGGHSVGDQVLQKIARVASQEGLKIFRKGGEEFVATHLSDKKLSLQLKKFSDRLESEIDFKIKIKGDRVLKDGTTYVDGEIIAKKGIGVSHGIDRNFEAADAKLQAHKLERTKEGKRSAKGSEPAGVRRINKPGGRRNNRGEYQGLVKTEKPIPAKEKKSGTTLYSGVDPVSAFKAFKSVVKAVIDTTKTDVIRYNKALKKSPAMAKIDGIIGQDKTPFNYAGVYSHLKTNLFDRFAPLEKVSPQAYEQARVFSAYKDISALKFEELADGLKPVKKHELLFTNYVTSHRVLTRVKRGIKTHGITIEEAKAAIRDTEAEFVKAGGKIEDLKTSFKNFQDWTNKHILKEALDSGIISKKSYDTIKKNNEFYAAFDVLERMPDNINNIPGLPSKEYFSVTNQGIIKGMTGTNKQIANPIEATIRKFTQAQATYARNRVASTFIDDPGTAKLLRPVAMSIEEFKALEKAGKKPVMNGAWSVKEFDTINRFKNGNVERYVAPIEIAEAMKAMSPAQSFRVVKAFNNVFRKAATTLYLPFTIGNAFRDALMAYTSSPTYSALTPHKFIMDWGKGLWEGGKQEFWKSDVAKQYIKDGGGFGYVGDLRKTNKAKAGLFKKGMIKTSADIVTSPFKLIEKISAMVELAPRLGVYGRAKKQGLFNPALIARESTIDFNRAGTHLRVLNQFIPFLNARVQARVVFAKALKRDPAGTLSKAFVSTVIPGLSLYLYNKLNHKDKYDDIPEYVKDNYFTMITGTGEDYRGRQVPEYIVMPKGDVGQIVWNPIEFTLDRFFSDNPDKLIPFAINYLNDLSPIEFSREGELSASKALGGVLPPVVKGVVEDTMGKNLYRGTDIVPHYMKENKPPELQTFENTPELYKSLGKKLGVSPLRLQNFASNILAGYGREGLDPNSMLKGLTGRFVKVQGGETERKALDRIEEIETGYNTARAYAQEAMKENDKSLALKIMKEWNSGISKTISEYNAEYGEKGLQDRGGLKKKYYFSIEKMQNVIKAKKDKRTYLEKQLSRR